MVELQEQLTQSKQRCSELAAAQLQSASSGDTVHVSAHQKLQQEVADMKSRLERQKEALLEKDRSYEEIIARLTRQEERERASNSEITSLRQQVCMATYNSSVLSV